MKTFKNSFIVHIKAAVLMISTIAACVFIMPSAIIAQEHILQKADQEIIIKDIENKNYPNIDLYINFKEGSRLGSADLSREDLALYEEGVAIHDFALSKIGQTLENVGIVLLIDTSASMRGKPIEDALSACALFIEEMNPNDMVSVIGFANDVTVYSDFSHDKQQLEALISGIEAEGSTSLYDGVLKAAKQFENIQGLKHRYIIVLSDGSDTESQITLEEAISKTLEQDVTVYSIALLSKDLDPADIEKISKETGGQIITTFHSEDLVSLYGQISQKIRNQYVLSFVSQSDDADKIQLQVSILKAGYEDSIHTWYANPFFESFEEDQEILQVVAYADTEDSAGIGSIIDLAWVKLAIYVLAFVSVTALIYAFSTMMLPGKQELKTRTDNYINSSLYHKSNIYEEEKHKEKIFTRLANLISKLTAKRGFTQLFEIKLKRAGMSIKSAEFILWHIISVVLVTLLAFLITKNLLITLLMVLIVIFAPFLLINFKTSQRIKKFNEQLPDTLQLIEGALKAGYSLNQSLVMVVKESKPPISEEFNIALSEIRMGLPEKDAMDNIAKRINSELFTWVITAINIQREVGGNLAEIMGIIANTIRDREKVLRQIKSLTAEGKLSAYVLIGLPIVMGIVLSVMNREYVGLLFSTTIGLIMLGVAALLMVVGIVWILKIIKIDY
jgi:tight adherence protein B